MIVELLNTGTELLSGQVVNTHAAFLAQRLAPLGLRISRQVAVPDGDVIRTAVQEALDRADLVFVTGGLGPTSDDITRDVVADLLGRPLEHNADLARSIEARFAERQIAMPQRVLVQALVPRGARILTNEHGTAPGLYLRSDAGKDLVLLPGPPREFEPMVEKGVVALLRELHPHAVPLRFLVLRTLGLGESFVQERVEDTLRAICPDLEIGYCARMGEVDLRLVGGATEAGFEAAAHTARRLLEGFIIAEGDISLEQLVVELAIERDLSLATAESCTGGFVAHRITNVPGSSRVFRGGAVVYSNDEKIRQLGVDPSLLDRHGAVSEPVAAAMARGMAERAQTDLAVATTGIAGPSGGTPAKPVGTLCLALFDRRSGQSHTATHPLAPRRDAFKYMAAQQALNLLRRALLKTL